MNNLLEVASETYSILGSISRVDWDDNEYLLYQVPESCYKKIEKLSLFCSDPNGHPNRLQFRRKLLEIKNSGFDCKIDPEYLFETFNGHYYLFGCIKDIQVRQDRKKIMYL